MMTVMGDNIADILAGHDDLLNMFCVDAKPGKCNYLFTLFIRHLVSRVGGGEYCTEDDNSQSSQLNEYDCYDYEQGGERVLECKQRFRRQLF